MRPHPRYSAAECSEAVRDYPSTPSPSSNQRQNQAKLHRLQKRNSQSEFSALRQLLRATSVLHIRSNAPFLVTCYPCSFVSSVGNVLFSHGFHGFSQIWLHVIRAHLCRQWEMFFSPTDFTDFHRFGYMLSVFICVISRECSFFPRICTDLHGFGYMLSVFICIISGKCSFLPRISRIFTDLVTCYPCSFVASVRNIFPPTDFTDFHRFGYMLSVFICVISGKYLSPTDFTDLHGFGYMLSVFICVVSGKCSFLPRISQIFTDLVTCYPCSFLTSVGNVLFSHGYAQICTDLFSW